MGKMIGDRYYIDDDCWTGEAEDDQIEGFDATLSVWRDSQGRRHRIDGEPAVHRIVRGDWLGAISDVHGDDTHYVHSRLAKYEWWIHGVKVAESVNQWQGFLKVCAFPAEDQIMLKLMK